mmetsp:Transcript_9456/g.32724  ORF Transcript_9456/g.32724 Transcript_9456/m.32724 type:complete len:217 (+) Transcript_9456:408-1058(+)
MRGGPDREGSGWGDPDAAQRVPQGHGALLPRRPRGRRNPGWDGRLQGEWDERGQVRHHEGRGGRLDRGPLGRQGGEVRRQRGRQEEQHGIRPQRPHGRLRGNSWRDHGAPGQACGAAGSHRGGRVPLRDDRGRRDVRGGDRPVWRPPRKVRAPGRGRHLGGERAFRARPEGTAHALLRIHGEHRVGGGGGGGARWVHRRRPRRGALQVLQHRRGEV